MTSQQAADSYLAAWQLLRHVPAALRLPLIDALVEIERARQEFARDANTSCT